MWTNNLFIYCINIFYIIKSKTLNIWKLKKKETYTTIMIMGTQYVHYTAFPYDVCESRVLCTKHSKKSLHSPFYSWKNFLLIELSAIYNLCFARFGKTLHSTCRLKNALNSNIKQKNVYIQFFYNNKVVIKSISIIVYY